MKRLGIVAALPAEASCFFTKKLPLKTTIKHDQTLLQICGMGPKNATVAAQALIDAGASHLVSWGTAGSLSQAAQPGDLILPKVVQNKTGLLLETDNHWRQNLLQQLPTKLQIHHDKLLESSVVIATSEQKSQLANVTDAIAVDMESYAIATVAVKQHVPFIIIRSIIDSFDEAIPASATNCVDEFGRTQIASLLSNLVKKPSDIPKLLHLGNHFKQARETLRQVTASTGTSLAFDLG